MKVSKVDPAVFIWVDGNGNVSRILACHVDDFLWGGSTEFEKIVINKIRSTFCVGKEDVQEKGSFPYVGIKLSQSENQLNLRQKMYQDNLQPIHIEKSRLIDRQSPITAKEKESLQSKIGQILWIARQSRSDTIFDASNLASSLKSAKVQTLIEANKIIKKLKSETVTIKFQKLGNGSDIKVLIFSGSSLRNLPDGGTQGGHFIVLIGKNGRISPITWQSKRIWRVVRSTLAAQTLAMADTIYNGVFLTSLFSELMTGDTNPENIVCLTDCHSLFDALKSTRKSRRKG